MSSKGMTRFYGKSVSTASDIYSRFNLSSAL